jgi:hypothetical protein
MWRYLSNLSRLRRPGAIRKVFSNPGMVPVRLFAPVPLGSVQAAVGLLPELSVNEAESYRSEIPSAKSLSDLNEAMMAVRGRPYDYKRCFEFVYILIRHLRPEVMVETGVFDGQSTALALEAFQRNGSGLLISIDLPATSVIFGSTHAMTDTVLPPGRDPGWLIPDSLRSHHRLLLGNSALLLPSVLTEFPEIDIFMHDSLHTYDHMTLEYRTAWPHIRNGGFLLSDDVFWNAAFHNFSKEKKRPYTLIPGDFGALRK